MNTPYELIIKYCRKQTSQEENLKVEQWLSEDDNLSLFLDLKKEWRYLDKPPVMTLDKLLVWRKIQKQCHLQHASKSNLLRPIVFIAAASVLVLLTALLSIHFFTRPKDLVRSEQYATLSTGANQKSRAELADGTQVWLNSNSRITFNNNYNIEQRAINATGELFFDVTPSDKKFIIHADKIRIEVLGTSFNLNTSDVDNRIGISLKRGRIAVFDAEKNKQLFVLDSSKYAVIDKVDLNYTLQTENRSNGSIWTEESLLMHNEPLSSIIDKLEGWYGIEISVVGLDMTKRYSFNLQTESLLEFLDLFSAITPIDYKLTGKKLFIEAIR